VRDLFAELDEDCKGAQLSLILAFALLSLPTSKACSARLSC
jgi:hypothetical protein